MPLIMKKVANLIFILILSVLFTSCNTDDLSKITDIIIDASSKNILVGEDVILTARANNGNDITNETTFFVNGTELQGNHFTPSQKGVYIIKGVFNDIESNLLEIEAKIATGYSQKALVEDFTGVWCGYCTRVAYAIKQIEANEEFGDKMVPVAIHLYESNDPFYCADGGSLKDAFNISGLPQGRINRTIVWTAPQPDNLDAVYSVVGGDAPLGIAINSSLDINTVNAIIRVGFAQDFTNLGLVIYLLEDELIHDQANYTDYFNGDDPILNFEHNDVLRKVYTNILGDVIPDTESVQDNVYEFTLQGNLPSTIENTDKLKLVVFVVDKTTNTAINVQSVALGEDQSFD
jgi:hypothetical protein